MCSVLLRVVLLSVTMLSIGCASRIPFGNNPATGQLVNLNGINLYFETYGAGEPLVLLHGNGDSIAGMATLIDHFSQQYRVIAVDSRGHGKSSPGQEPLTYDLMADDVAALLEHLGTGPVKLLGWSDGGNIGLILALRHPQFLSKLAVMGAALNPQGARPWAFDVVAAERAYAEGKLAVGDTEENWPLALQLLDLLEFQPDLQPAQLGAIEIPVLVMVGDRDIIRNSHALEMFEHLQLSQLAILPGTTHFAPLEQPMLFNAIVDRFFSEPFAMPDTRDIFEIPAQ